MAPEQATLDSRRQPRRVDIRLSDGTTLAALLWLPTEAGRVPAVISFNPYRNDYVDGLLLDRANLTFAERGYAAVIVDFRGSGDSSGELALGFGLHERRDGAEVVEWVARQPWCDGGVAVWGSSWLGMAALWAASERPPHLRAAAALVAPTDVFAGYLRPGGCEVCAVEPLTAANMLALQMMPPLGALDSEAGVQAWSQRLDALRPFGLTWREQADSPASRRAGAIAIEAISAPTLLIGGWHDVAVEGTIGAFERLSPPRQLLVGPWSHDYPDAAERSPVDHVEVLLQWWDRWLRGSDERLAPESTVTYFIQGKNEWRSSEQWPPVANTEELWLTPTSSLARHPERAATTVRHTVDPTVGVSAARWQLDGLPAEQSDDDARSMCFTTDARDDWIEIVGRPRARLQLDPETNGGAQITVRLSDVAPGGRSRLITVGQARVAGQTASGSIEIPMRATAYALAPGHRLRLAISGGEFPFLWPAPAGAEVRVVCGGDHPSVLTLPHGHCATQSVEPPPTPEPRHLPFDAGSSTVVERELESGTLTLRQKGKMSLVARDGVTRIEVDFTFCARIDPRDSVMASIATTIRIRSDAPARRSFVVVTHARMTAREGELEGAVEVDGESVKSVGWRRGPTGVQKVIDVPEPSAVVPSTRADQVEG